jgi:5-methylcytosine-specific restriction endonuclease McrA
MCHPCRRAGLSVHKRTTHRHTCPACGAEFEHINKRAKYCSRLCGATAGQRGGATTFRPASHPKVKRAKLEAQAPGLSNKRRLALLAEWRRKGAICVYCGLSPADTVDHIVPLVLGGTNYEGNLAPCCRKCNSSKAGLTVSEWRHGMRIRRHVLPMPVRAPKPPKMRTAGIQIEMKSCPVCGALHARAKYCSEACCTEGSARAMRDRYRAAHGLPVDPCEPTSKWAIRG